MLLHFSVSNAIVECMDDFGKTIKTQCANCMTVAANFCSEQLAIMQDSWPWGEPGRLLPAYLHNFPPATAWTWSLAFISTPPWTFMVLILSTRSALSSTQSYNLTFSHPNIENSTESDAILHVCLGNTVNSCLSGLMKMTIWWLIKKQTSQIASHFFLHNGHYFKKQL
jgi:hypothetical protein